MDFSRTTPGEMRSPEFGGSPEGREIKDFELRPGNNFMEYRELFADGSVGKWKESTAHNDDKEGREFFYRGLLLQSGILKLDQAA